MVENNQQYITVSELAERISVSVATVRNWIKLNKISPDMKKNGKFYFSQITVGNILELVSSNSNNILKSRRNKKYLGVNGVNVDVDVDIRGDIYKNYLSKNSKNIKTVEKLISIICYKKIRLDKDLIKLILAECGIQLVAQRKNIQVDTTKSMVYEYLNSKLELGCYSRIIDDFIDDKNTALDKIKANPEIFSLKYVYEESEDLLGLIYQSCEKISHKKSKGAYYTPTNVVKKLVSRLEFQQMAETDKILDPCCGGGNFLLQLPSDIDISQIYANDKDFVSLSITRLNMALKYEVSDIEVLYKNFTNKDYLSEYDLSGFKYIIGNPPWGARFSAGELKMLKSKYEVASDKIESYEVFIEKSLQILDENGILSFVLPESVLNIKTHKDIRQLIKKSNSVRYVEVLGEKFDKVQCPSVIIEILHNNKPFSYLNTKVKVEDKSFVIRGERDISADSFLFCMTDEEYEIIKKITSSENKVYLKDNAKFALGIVTGDNKNLLQAQKSEHNEPIVKGSEVTKYRLLPAKNYIEFLPNKFQQVAPTELYRSNEKLLYRFISKELVFAYDNKQTLSLNSCNILIPLFKELDIKYVLAVLNSSIAQFLFNKIYHSIKVLRSHIESIPIPKCGKNTQLEIIQLANKLIIGEDSYSEIYRQIDELLLPLYGLSKQDYEIINPMCS